MTREPYEDTILRTIHGMTKKGGTKLQAIPHPEHGGGATPRFWTPTTPPTNCWPEAPWGGGGGLGGGGSGRGAGEGCSRGCRGYRGGGGVGHLGTVGYAAQEEEEEEEEERLPRSHVR